MRRVLVVDDNKDAANSLATLVRLMGHDCQVAFDGFAAVHIARTWLPDLIFLDIRYARHGRLRSGGGNTGRPKPQRSSVSSSDGLWRSRAVQEGRLSSPLRQAP